MEGDEGKMIRSASKSNFSIIKTITQTAIEAVYPKYYPSGAVQYFIDYHSDDRIMADIEARKVYMFDDHGRIVGTVTVSDNEISRLFVYPDFQHMGYGKELMDYAEETIALRNYDHIILDASLPAKQMYLNRGYVATKYNMIETENGDYLCFDVMEKKI